MSSPHAIPLAAGGVLIDEQGGVLLRRPTNGFGDYAWTYPKGRVDVREGETPEQAALREVLEESGWEAEIVSQVQGPDAHGDFRGTTTFTRFYVMRPVRQVQEPDPAETEALRWASPHEARQLIGETPSEQGRARDLAVLELVVALPPG